MAREAQFHFRATKMQQREKTQKIFGESRCAVRLTPDSPHDSRRQGEKL
jgi:hypothetical protein